ncbi:hypothetical protein VHUM_02030 [Vanrija humicola]|uniref:Major facilitator superfamily (MFS) profile domain-containing protein n=1 Tax=Vanrija humicola TaxID=5417 RepID=A0A7D8Z4M5_VANHU|nr:hypothetical protein VHUM_02030 [Vanrija humicola]
MVWACYFLNYLDRNAIAQARLNGIEKNLGLVGTQYNTCISILFVGYVSFQIPSNMLISTQRVRPSLWMTSWMLAWAVVSACTALTKNYIGLLVCRLLLGLAEAPFYPGALYLLSLFYTRREIATRISILYTALILATSFSGLIAAATFATLDGAHGIEGWRWLFIIEGVVTFGVAMFGFIILPDHPTRTRWLSPREREVAQARIDRDTVAISEKTGALAGFGQAIKDPKLGLLVLTQTLHLASNSFNSFFPTVVKGLGFSNTITLVLTCPPYLVSGFVSVLVGMSSGRRNERTWHITIPMVFAIIGFVISCVTLNVGARYLAAFLFCSGAYACNSVILGWVTATCGQTQEKKAAALSMVNTSANATYIYTPYLYPASDGPKYVTANAANAGFAFGTIACSWGLRFWLKAENRKIREENPDSTLYYAY